jgi:DNA-binding CsgD family transcriptional regulator
MKERSLVAGDEDLEPNTATALVAALGLAREHGGAAAAPRPRRRNDPTAFVMDRELVVQAAEGESILRLPWFVDDLFVSRQLPDITEMPREVRTLCIDRYSAALTGERGRFAFTSYGHSYSVDAVPVHGDGGRVEGVLAIATPMSAFTASAAAHDRLADRLDCSATDADQRAERHRLADRSDAAASEIQAAQRAREAAGRARADARRLRSRETGAFSSPSLTPRETEVLSLASHGLTYTEIAEHLAVTGATVRTHLQHVYAKLGARDKASAVATALRHRLIA